MTSAFHVCNPYCGLCKPPKPAPVECPKCGRFHLDEVLPKYCAKCGAPLPERPPVEPILCAMIHQMCANPCGFGRNPPDDGVEHVSCGYHTPLEP